MLRFEPPVTRVLLPSLGILITALTRRRAPRRRRSAASPQTSVFQVLIAPFTGPRASFDFQTVSPPDSPAAGAAGHRAAAAPPPPSRPREGRLTASRAPGRPGMADAAPSSPPPGGAGAPPRAPRRPPRPRPAGARRGDRAAGWRSRRETNARVRETREPQRLWKRRRGCRDPRQGKARARGAAIPPTATGSPLPDRRAGRPDSPWKTGVWNTAAIKQGYEERDLNFVFSTFSPRNTRQPGSPFMLVVRLHDSPNFPHFRHGLLVKDKHKLEKPVLI